MALRVPQIPPAIHRLLQSATTPAHATWWRFWRDLRDNLATYWHQLNDVSGEQGNWQLRNVAAGGAADDEDLWITFRRDDNLANYSASGRTWCAFRFPRITEGPTDTNGSPIFEVQYTDNLRSSTDEHPYDGWIPVLKFEETGTLAAVREPGSHGSFMEAFQDLMTKPAYRQQDWDPNGDWAPRSEFRNPLVDSEDYVGIGRVGADKALQVWEPLTGSAWNDTSSPGTLARIRCKDIYGAEKKVEKASILTLTSATPELLPAPGPNRLYQLVSACVRYKYATAAYGNDQGIYLKYGTAGPVLTNVLTGITTAGADRYMHWDVLPSTSIAADLVPNDSIVLQHANSNPTDPGGNAAGYLDVFLTVRIHHLS